MDWNIFGTIAEIAASLAVIIALIDIARQTRRGNNQNRVNTIQNTVTSLNTLAFVIAQSPQVASVVARGRSSFSSLNEAEQLQFEHIHGPLLNIIEAWGFQIDIMDNTTDRNAAQDSMRGIVRTYFNFPGAMQFWDKHKHLFAEEVHRLIKEEAKGNGGRS